MAADDDDESEEGTALAVPTSSAADEYERKYMAGQGTVLARAKQRAPGWMQLATGSIGLFGVAMLGLGSWAVGLALIPLGFLMWALFSLLRVTVSEGAVKVQQGLFGPTIPIASIVSAEAIEYDWKKFGGWGIRLSSDGEWMYNMPGDGGHAVRIVWHTAKGKRRVTNIAAAIGRARRMLPAASEPAALDEGD